ncbi:hypothetical protein HBH70_150600 [Parastagonospora nodorum]|nr:hypothetical protein HBH53_045370 [Parastagonospora nodorum]KAH3979691.1 hypothetical protein HBH51_056380 [Parastagonospora nodorum]KAH4180394.1 hypothetical protein HBH43_003450 [Parastagonospora nodorum]KAH4201171.1 hypothetical protein HBH42_025720 [Parastagonospora nodorum]KAH4209143.1 hypothetical protein HBI95_086020 [Parastagonospora nodorum]
MKKHSSHPKAEPFAEDTDWHSDCESVDGPLADQVKAKAAQPRAKKQEAKQQGCSSLIVGSFALFDEKPFDTYYPDNMNKLCC